MAVDLNAMAAVERNKEARRAALIRAAQPIAKAVVDGKVRVWHLLEQRWKTLHPVDAREQIGMGLAALEVVDMLDPDNKLVKVDALQAESFREQGYRYPGEVPPRVKAAGSSAGKSPLKEKQDRASKLGIVNAKKLSEADLDKAITEVEGKQE